MAPANVAYTSYMHSLALRGGPLGVPMASLPSVRVELRRDRGRSAGTHRSLDHPAYGGWIGRYFSLPSNVEMVEAMRRDFDALVAEEVTTDST